MTARLIETALQSAKAVLLQLLADLHRIFASAMALLADLFAMIARVLVLIALVGTFV